jgi:hypothetical protein
MRFSFLLYPFNMLKNVSLYIFWVFLGHLCVTSILIICYSLNISDAPLILYILSSFIVYDFADLVSIVMGIQINQLMQFII